MRLALHAECRMAGIPLRASGVPLQITVPDGGEDGRVEWKGAASSTDYFPRRFCHRTMVGYHLKQIVSLLKKHGEIDSRVASSLVQQLLSICKRDNADVFHQSDRPVRSILKSLIQPIPKKV